MPDVAYDNLVGKPATTVPGWSRVSLGEKDRSLLFVNVAAKTEPDTFTAPLRAMPLGVLPALTTNELEALRRWIEVGAPREGTVAGTADLLDACLPPQKPIEIDPLPPPAAGEGVQIHMPRWELPKQERARSLLRQLLRHHRPGAGGIPRTERHRSATRPSRSARIRSAII